jgi:hypothetical protein
MIAENRRAQCDDYSTICLRPPETAQFDVMDVLEQAKIDDQPPLSRLLNLHVLVSCGFFSGAAAALMLFIPAAILLPEGAATVVIITGAFCVGICAARSFRKASNTARRRFAIVEYFVIAGLSGAVFGAAGVSLVWDQIFGDLYGPAVYLITFFGAGATVVALLFRRQRRTNWRMFYD